MMVCLCVFPNTEGGSWRPAAKVGAVSLKMHAVPPQEAVTPPRL